MNKHYRDPASRYADIGAINGHEEQYGLDERQEDKLSHARRWLLLISSRSKRREWDDIRY